MDIYDSAKENYLLLALFQIFSCRYVFGLGVEIKKFGFPFFIIDGNEGTV